MNKQFVLFSIVSALLAGSFLGNYFRNHPFGAGKNAVVQAKSLIDGAAGDQSQLAQASDLLRSELSENPDNLLALFLQGRALQQRGLIDAALESYRQYFDRKISVDFAAHYNAGELYELKGDLEAAERHYRGCITAAPQAEGWEKLIRLLLRQNRVQEARVSFDSLAKQFPDSRAVKNLSAIMPP